nr:S8/S53 family peptidase [Comamonas koreensis]
MKSLILLLGAAASTAAAANEFQPASFSGFEIQKATNPITEKFIFNKKSKQANSELDRKLYKIVLNPFFIQSLWIENGSITSQEKLTSENGTSIEIPTSYLTAAGVFTSDHEIEDYYFLGPLQPAIYLWLNQKSADTVRLDQRISSIAEIEASSTTKMSATNPPVIPGDINAGNEKTSWGVNYVAASNAANNQYNNSIYVVDGNPIGMHPNASNDLNYNFIKDAILANGTFYNNVHKWHTAHVMGIIGAKSNNQNVRGVNPGQPIRLISAAHYITNGHANDQLATPGVAAIDRENIEIGIDLAALDAESNGIFSVLNVSYNGESFNHFSPVGKAMRRASNRHLIVESAGNNSESACNHAYNNTQDNDGIVVVGGIKRDGTIFTVSDNGFTGLPNDPDTGHPEPAIGSNFGPCVELWAPGFNITSLDFFDGATRVSTGTSFSAPFTAAVASRWGNNETRPIIREQLLKLHAYTGSIGKLVKYGTLYQSRASNLLPITNITQRGSNVDILKLRNSKYYDVSEFFKFPGQTGSLIADLGSEKSIKGVRLTMIASAEGNGINSANFTVSGSNDMINFYPIGSASDTRITNWGPVYIPINTASYRYLEITGTNPLSQLGYSEVEVYGR